MHPKISVVVPVYNTAPYLRRCLDSICHQTFQDFEVIVVDDGSTDNSLEICNEYAERDKRFRVFHTENKGVGAARQFALERLEGDYMACVDSDDWVEPEMLEGLYKKAQEEDSDLVFCDFRIAVHNRIIEYSFCKEKVSNSYLWNLIMNSENRMLWNKLIRIETLKCNNLSFEPFLRTNEDTLLLLRLLYYHNPRISYLPQYLYLRYARKESVTANLAASILHQRKLVSIVYREFPIYLTKDLIARHIFSLFMIRKISSKEIRELLCRRDIRYAIWNYDKAIPRLLILSIAAINPLYGFAHWCYESMKPIR